MQPENFSVVVGDGEHTISWDPPAEGLGEPVTGYFLYMVVDNAPLILSLNGGGSKSISIQAEEPSGLRTYAVSAKNTFGEGPPTIPVALLNGYPRCSIFNLPGELDPNLGCVLPPPQPCVPSCP